MPVVLILRDLWRLRLLVAIVAAVALLAGLATLLRLPSLQLRQHDVGVASTSAVLDTQRSQFVDAGADVGGSIGDLTARATLWANLITSSPIKHKIAATAKIDPKLLVTPPPKSTGAIDTLPQVSDTTVQASDPRAYVLRAAVPAADPSSVPEIQIATRAPDAAGAAKVADAAIATLKAEIEARAETEQTPIARRLVLDPRGAAQATTTTEGPGPLVAFGVALLVFLFGVAGVLLVSWIVRSWHEAARAEREAENELLAEALADADAPTRGRDAAAA